MELEPVDLSIHDSNSEKLEPIDLSIRDEPVQDDVHKPTEQPKSASTKAPEKIKSETIAGYVEWMHDDYLIADGQRVRWDARTRTRIGRVRSVNAIPLGYEVKVKGFRNTEGAVVAEEIEAKPNGAAMFEADVIAAINTIENQWLREGQMIEPQPDGRRTAVGSGLWIPARGSNASDGSCNVLSHRT